MRRIISLILVVIIFAACSKDSAELNLSDNVVSITSAISTRVTDDSWDGDEIIGVFMSDSSDASLGDNVKFETSSSNKGVFTSATSLYYPTSGGATFFAYYPYVESVDLTAYPIDSSNPVDLLAAEESVSTVPSGAVDMTFYHKLSKVAITLKASGGITDDDLSKVKITISGISTTADFNLKTDEVSSYGGLTSLELPTPDALVSSAIVIPQTDLSNLKFEFTSDGIGTLSASPTTAKFESGKEYGYTITINGYKVEVTSSNIESWTPGGEESYTAQKEADTYDIEKDSSSGYYYIYTGKGLEAFADIVNGTENTGGAVCGDGVTFSSDGTAASTASAVLMADIDLSEVCVDGTKDWVPIGSSSSNDFSGTFDGNYYKVTDIYINNDSQYVGLFGKATDATIKNVGVVGGTIETSNSNGYAGGVVGYASLATGATASVSNCYNDGVSVASKKHSGGVVGYASGTSVTNCYNTGAVSVSADSSRAGGIVGLASYSSTIIVNCYNTGAVSTTGASGSYAGGIVGYVSNDAMLVTSCYNTASVLDESSSGSDNYAGGIVGYNKSLNVTSCYWASDVTTNGVGYNDDVSVTLTGQTSSSMTGGTLAGTLNTAAEAYNSSYPSAIQACAWVGTTGAYPTLDFTSTPQ